MNIDINMDEFVDLTREYTDTTKINTIFEIGSLDAKDSLFFKGEFPDANVYAIEGLTENYDMYMKHLTNINPINIVISNFDGTISYHKKDINGLHGILNRGDLYGKTVIEGLPCKRIDTICTELGLTSIDMVKIDVEGATQQILESMGNIIETIKIMHIETESYPFFKGQVLHDDVCNYLISKDFTMVRLSEVDITSNGKQHDSVWVNNRFKK
jgi:FkbM family methyltransferase